MRLGISGKLSHRMQVRVLPPRPLAGPQRYGLLDDAGPARSERIVSRVEAGHSGNNKNCLLRRRVKVQPWSSLRNPSCVPSSLRL